MPMLKRANSVEIHSHDSGHRRQAKTEAHRGWRAARKQSGHVMGVTFARCSDGGIFCEMPIPNGRTGHSWKVIDHYRHQDHGNHPLDVLSWYAIAA